MDISKLTFDNLTVKRGPESIYHSPEYIKQGSGAKAKRRIFYGVPLDNFEKQQIEELERELREKRINMLPGWNERESLKYLYATKFDHEKAIERIKKCIAWRNNPVSRTLTNDVLRLFETGALYMYGRDKQYRPIIVFDFGKVDFNEIKGEDFNVAITVLLDIAIRYCYAPGKIENNIIIIDTRKLSLTSLPISTMKNWVEIGDACFPSNLFKTYIVGPPFLIRMSWKVVENLLSEETAEKIELLAVDELDKIQAIIDPSQLEKKFGGNVPDLTTFWPPVSSYNIPLSHADSFHSLNGSFNQSFNYNNNLNKPQTPSMTDHYLSNPRPYDTNPYRSGLGSNEPPKFNERFTSAPRIEPSGHIDSQYSSGGLGTNQRYTSASRIEATGFNDPYQKGERSVFDTKPGRASQGVSHSPMTGGRFDSPSLYDRPVQHEAIKKSAAPPVFTSVRNEMLDQLGDDRTKEKRMDETLDKQLGLQQTHYYAPIQHAERRRTEESITNEQPSSKGNSNQDLMNMILKEDRIIRGGGPLPTEPDTLTQIPNESANVQARITERELASAKLKQHVDMAHSPHRNKYTSSTDYHPYGTHATFAGSTSFDHKVMSPAESFKKSSRPPIPEETSFERSEHRSFTGATPVSPQKGVVFNGVTMTNTGGKPVDDWPQRKMRELPRPGTEEDESDDDGVFCGVCVSTKGTKAKKAARS